MGAVITQVEFVGKFSKEPLEGIEVQRVPFDRDRYEWVVCTDESLIWLELRRTTRGEYEVAEKEVTFRFTADAHDALDGLPTEEIKVALVTNGFGYPVDRYVLCKVPDYDPNDDILFIDIQEDP